MMGELPNPQMDPPKASLLSALAFAVHLHVQQAEDALRSIFEEHSEHR